MANILSTDKQAVIVGALAEGFGPVTSAVEAVRAAIVQEFRSLEPTQEN